MPITHTGKLTLSVKSDLSNAVDLNTVVDRLSKIIETLFANGTGAGQVNNAFHDTRTLATGANENIDLAGSLQNIFGVTLTFTKIKTVLIHAKSTNTTNLTVSRPAANGLPLFGAASDALAPLTPGAFFLFVDPSDAGIAVTAGTGDLITVTNAAGASADYDIVILGAT